MTQSISFVKQLMEAFLSGFAIATVVHLVVFPRSSRDVVLDEFKDYCAALKRAIRAQQKYLQTMEHGDMLQQAATGKTVSDVEKAAKDLKAALTALGGLHAKIHAELPFAKREVTYGHLGAKDVKKFFGLLRAIFLPVQGLGSIADIFERLASQRGWNRIPDNVQDSGSSNDNLDPAREEAISEWNEIMRTLHHPFEAVSQGMIDGIDHASYAFRLAKRPRLSRKAKTQGDKEANAGLPEPGDSNFSEYLRAIDEKLWDSRAAALKVWCAQKGVLFPDSIDAEAVAKDFEPKITRITTQETSRHQLYLILYMEYLLHAASRGVLDLVKFADEKLADGSMERRRLLLPGRKRMRKWIAGAFSIEDGSNHHAPDSAEAQMNSVALGDAFKKQKDPEHLPPTNGWQRFGNGVREISHMLRSNEMAFGFRVACATMSIAIVAFLEQTQTFFVTQRLVWAMIMVRNRDCLVFRLTVLTGRYRHDNDEWLRPVWVVR